MQLCHVITVWHFILSLVFYSFFNRPDNNIIRNGNGKCTYDCGIENKNDYCDRESDDHCSCFDDVGKLWKANETETIEHECSEYQPNLNGKLFFLKFLLENYALIC